MKSPVSDTFCDEIVFLCYGFLAGIPEEQLTDFMRLLLYATAAEVRRAVAETRAKDLVGSSN